MHAYVPDAACSMNNSRCMPSLLCRGWEGLKGGGGRGGGGGRKEDSSEWWG